MSITTLKYLLGIIVCIMMLTKNTWGLENDTIKLYRTTFTDSIKCSTSLESFNYNSDNNQSNKRVFHILFKGSYDFRNERSGMPGSGIVTSGVSITGEILYYSPEVLRVMFGVGMEYQLGRDVLREPTGGEFSFIPMYFTYYMLPLKKNGHFF